MARDFIREANMARYDPNDPKHTVTRYVATLKEDVRRVIMSQHLVALRDYARRVVQDGEWLPLEEDVDREVRVREFLALGESFNVKQKDLVTLLYKDMFVAS